MTESVWPEHLGGITMLIVGILPISIFDWSGAADSSSDWSVRWLGALAPVPIIALVAVVAPLVGYRRRDAFGMLVPFLNVLWAWQIGSRLGRLSVNAQRAVPGRR